MFGHPRDVKKTKQKFQQLAEEHSESINGCGAGHKTILWIAVSEEASTPFSDLTFFKVWRGEESTRIYAVEDVNLSQTQI